MTDKLTELVAGDRQENSRKYSKSNSKYPEISAEVKAEALASDIKFQTKGLLAAAGRGRVDFHDLEDVKKRTREYFTACAEAEGAVIPSFLGLCTHGFGISRSATYKYLATHSGEPAAEFIEMTRDALADILCSAALRRDADNSTAIFVLKNCHNFVDRVEVTPVQTAPPVEQIDVEALQRRIMGSVVLDD